MCLIVSGNPGVFPSEKTFFTRDFYPLKMAGQITSVGEIPSGRGETIGSHFGLRLPEFVHIFGRKHQKSVAVFLKRAVLAPIWRETRNFPAKNRPV